MPCACVCATHCAHTQIERSIDKTNKAAIEITTLKTVHLARFFSSQANLTDHHNFHTIFGN